MALTQVTNSRKYNIHICHGRESAMQTCAAPNQQAAWEVAWQLSEKLLGPTTIPRMISVQVQP
jgi:hypothetical protein